MLEKFAEDVVRRYQEKLAWMANRHNYTHGTSAKFSPASKPDKEPDCVSKSDSEYWISPMGVTRDSDHWGTVGSCDWRLGKNKFPKKKVYGFSPWENFEKKASALSVRDKIPIQYLKNLSLSKLRNLINKLPSGQIYEVTGEGAQRFGQESFVNAAIGSKKDGFSNIVNNEIPFNAFVKTPKSDKINWNDKLNIFRNPDNSNILAPTFIGLDSNSSAIIQKAMNQNTDTETLKRLVQNLNAKIKRKALKIDPVNQFKKYTDWVNQVTSTNYHNRAHTPVVKGADGSNYLLSDIYTNTNPNIPPFGGRNTGNMGVDPDTNKLLIFDPRVTKLTPDNLADLDSAMLKTSSALSDIDVSNWDNLSTEERNAIIKLMKPHTFAQLPGDRLGYGYEGSA